MELQERFPTIKNQQLRIQHMLGILWVFATFQNPSIQTWKPWPTALPSFCQETLAFNVATWTKSPSLDRTDGQVYVAPKKLCRKTMKNAEEYEEYHPECKVIFQYQYIIIFIYNSFAWL